jgi:uncharacterized protein involved in exopolysaccharide biosynthesis
VIVSEQETGGDRHEIDVLALGQVVWHHKYVVAATAVLCTLAAIYLAFTAAPIYRAEVVVSEVSEKGMGGAGSLASQFGGLATLAGMNLDSAGRVREHMAVLESRRLAEEFVKRSGIVPLLPHGSNRQPSLWIAVQQFRKDVVAINEDKLKGVTTVTMDWGDPVIAARWANQFVALANELVRIRALEDASANIDYLNKQIARTNVVEVQRVMYDLIESETKTLMLANGRVEYAFTVVDPAVPPEVRVSPKRTLMAMTGMAIGLLVGGILALAYGKVVGTRASRRRSM